MPPRTANPMPAAISVRKLAQKICLVLTGRAAMPPDARSAPAVTCAIPQLLLWLLSREMDDSQRLPRYDDDSPGIFQILCDSAAASRAAPFIPPSPRAVSKTDRNIAGVNRPVNVFC